MAASFDTHFLFAGKTGAMAWTAGTGAVNADILFALAGDRAP